MAKCNLFTHGAPRSSQELVQKCLCIPDRIGIWKCWFLRRGANRSTRRKTSRSRVENQQQTQPTYDAGSGNRTRVTLVGGEHSHHCAIPAPLIYLCYLAPFLERGIFTRTTLRRRRTAILDVGESTLDVGEQTVGNDRLPADELHRATMLSRTWLHG